MAEDSSNGDKGNGKEVVGPSVNMTEEGKNKNNKQNKGKKRDFKEHSNGSGSNKKPKLKCWKCGKTDHFKRDCRSGNKKNANAGDLVIITMDMYPIKRKLEMSKDALIHAIDENPDKCSLTDLQKEDEDGKSRKPIDKFKARLVIQCFRQKERIDYFDACAPVARITTIRLLLAYCYTQYGIPFKDVKTTFLNGDLEEEVYMKQPEGFVMSGNEHKVCKLVKSMYGLKQAPELEYSRVIGCLMYAMTSTRPNIAYAVSRLGRFTSNPSRQHWQAIKRVFKYLKDSSFTSGWVFLLRGGTISWASKKQTCITGSTIESKFVALSTVGKEAEWLRNLIHEIPIWPKPIAPISIRCDSAPTMAKAYSQIYNGKSRHLGVRHSMIRELIMNGVISIEFVRSQKNLADHLTKGLARDLVNKSVIGMGLKSI
ncbi:zinc finger, CCHC-type containing protein [Tanacetum coccineum]